MKRKKSVISSLSSAAFLAAVVVVVVALSGHNNNGGIAVVVLVGAAEADLDPFQGGPKERDSHTYEGNFPIAELGEKWKKLDQKHIYYDQDENEFTVTYHVHENITESDADVTFWDKNCTDLDNELFRRDGLDDIDIDIDADTPGTMTYAFKLDLGKLRDNPYDLWLDDVEANTARLMMCARIRLMASINGEIYEVNYEETVFQLDFDMSNAGFTLEEFQVAPKIREATTENKAYGVNGYLCNPDEPSVELNNNDNAVVFRQGELISVCVTPTPESLQEGLRMDSILSFTWYQYEPNPIQQEAVKNGAASQNFLTVLNCVPGSVYCSLTSVLFAQYYAVPLPEGNYVEGNGVALMRFGGDGDDEAGAEIGRRRRRSRSLRSLQEDADADADADADGLEPEDIGVVFETEAVEDDGYGKLRTADAAGNDGWFRCGPIILIILSLFINPLLLLT